MLTHYMTLIARVFSRSKLHSAIALIGLTIGLTVSFLTALTVWQETHYDGHVPNVERLYLVESHLSATGRSDAVRNTTMAPLSEALETGIAGVENSARVWRQWTSYTRSDNSIFNQPTFYTDASFFELFPVQLLSGSLEATFASPTTVMISRRMAETLFGDTSIDDKTLIADGDTVLKVTAVYENLPTNSHLEFEMVSPINAPQIYTRSIKTPSWQSISVMTYALLEEGAAADQIERDMQRLVQDRSGGTIKSRGAAVRNVDVSLMPVQDIHLYGGPYANPVKPKGDLNELLSIFAIGLLVLVVACFNHINLATAQAMKRAREVAMRKVVGANQGQLIVQFLSEAAIYCMAAWVVALALTEMLLPYAQMFVGQPLVQDLLWAPSILMVQLAIVLFVTLGAGFYPAIYLSRFMPQKILKSDMTSTERGKVSLRAILVVAQFAISIGLIIAASVIFAQIKYTQKIDLGFDEKNLVILDGVRRGPAGTVELTRSLENAMKGRPGIISITGSSATPAVDKQQEARLRLTSSGESGFETLSQLSVGLDYFSTYKIPVLAGRAFSDDFAVDRLQWDLEARQNAETPVILNERAVAAMGLGGVHDAVGKSVMLEVSAGDERAARIVGVVSDFHFSSLKSAIAPTVFYPDPSQFDSLTVRIDPAVPEIALASIEEGWATILDDQAVSSDYVDQAVVRQYENEAHQLRVVGALAGLAIIIALLGLYGLASFMMERRAREVGIRKVLGANDTDIVYLMVWQFSRPVLFANILAWPLVWYLASSWLEGFAYRIDLSFVPFVAASAAALLAAWLIVGGKAWGLARTNPVNALRYE